MIQNYVKIAKRLLGSQSWENDGFVYNFLKIENSGEYVDALRFLVDVTLPDPKQSWVVEKFDHDVAVIIEKLFDFIGERISYQIEILIDGQEIPSEGVYINLESKQKIIQEINDQFSRIDLKDISFDVIYTPSDKFYEIHGDSLDMYFDLTLSNFSYRGKKREIEPSELKRAAGYISNEIIEKENLYIEIEEVVYRVLEPQIKIHDVDVYFSINMKIVKIDGWNSKKFGWSPDPFSEIIFTEIS